MSSWATTLLGVVIGEKHAFRSNPVDIGRLVAHQAVTVGTDIGDANIVAPNDENVNLLSCA